MQQNQKRFKFLEEDLYREHFDLPDADIILYKNVFRLEKSDALYNSLYSTICWQQDKIKFFGKEYEVPRLTALYGDVKRGYSYSGISMNPYPWTEDLLFVKKRIEEIAKVRFTSCLLNLYRTGRDSNDWHQDNEKELGRNPVIASVSFGETRPFKLKHIENVHVKPVTIPLTHGSVLLMKGTTQHFWKHKIPKTSKIISPRINLTYRIINP
ncbi:alpha-ketoglutarate-dependent dioxygenase AlkB family protein [Aestuariivivens sediminis]|uniref:alpha-ketoglutarate-dependent dioxygenase AlkB family protein n=1 Tax=Aestuariivivens sediminis TaxID=2913557 RepID=UPI001F56F98B|nr:alpha-ketoglutarate-dependent dioxygenase AlkB [Aestuariivivens sediminis]